MKIWALHGFLGQPSDFDSLQNEFTQLWPAAVSSLHWNSIDYLKIKELSPEIPLKQWGVNFNQFISQENLRSDGQNSKQCLIGYSQGGRLALEALKANPQFWNQVVLISTSPGLDAKDKESRQRADEKWAQDFVSKPFQETLEAWNSQSVFQGSDKEPRRGAKDFDLEQLAKCLNHWSVAQQDPSFSFLEGYPSELLYLAGDRDSKYVEIGKNLEKRSPQIKFQSIENSGHRVIFDQPKRAAACLGDYLRGRLNFNELSMKGRPGKSDGPE